MTDNDWEVRILLGLQLFAELFKKAVFQLVSAYWRRQLELPAVQVWIDTFSIHATKRILCKPFGKYVGCEMEAIFFLNYETESDACGAWQIQ